MININGLSKKYTALQNDIIALDNVTLNIATGDFVAIIGESGSGKTTLLNMLSGLDTPDSGAVSIDGTVITRLSQNEAAKLRRQKIGVIYQFYNLVPELNMRDNITLPTELDKRRIDEERLAKIIEAVGLSGRELDFPAALSGGQQQRVAIARALYGNPSLILADEPTGNLDERNGDEILRLLYELNEKHGITVIVVTHSRTVAAAAKRVISLECGKVVSDDRR